MMVVRFPVDDVDAGGLELLHRDFEGASNRRMRLDDAGQDTG